MLHLDLTAAIQFKTTGNGTVWLDNLYFWKASSAAGTVTTLSDLTVDGSTIAGFASTSISYSVELPSGITVLYQRLLQQQLTQVQAL